MDALRRFYERIPLPPATRALFAINVAVFVVNAVLLGRLSEPRQGGWFAFAWSGLFDGYGLGALRVLSYQFTHAFADPMHLVMNMVSLWVFGPVAEGSVGRSGLLRLYLWGGFVGAIGHVLVATAQGAGPAPLVGASGACYALMVYAACVAPQLRIVFVLVVMPLWGLASLLVAWGAYELFTEFAQGAFGGVSHSAHLGGALLGFVAYRAGWFRDWLDLAGRPRVGWFASLRAAWRRARSARAAVQQQVHELQLDTILAKVKAQGLASLSADERRFLDRVSRQARGG